MLARMHSGRPVPGIVTLTIRADGTARESAAQTIVDSVREQPGRIVRDSVAPAT